MEAPKQDAILLFLGNRPHNRRRHGIVQAVELGMAIRDAVKKDALPQMLAESPKRYGFHGVENRSDLDCVKPGIKREYEGALVVGSLEASLSKEAEQPGGKTTAR